MSYTGETTNFGLPYRQDGDISSGAQEQVAWEGLDGALQGAIDGVGVGVLEGGVGAIDGGLLVISPLLAIIPDGSGGVLVEHVEETYGAGEFGEGDSYIHAQLTATSRADRSCTYYIDTDPTPLADAICLVRVTVAAGVITAVDNTVKAAPAIEARLAWERIKRSADDPSTLLENLSDWLGTAYVGETPPADVDTRLTALEGGGGTAVSVEDDCFRANDIRSRLLQVRSHSPDVVATQRNAIYIVDGVYGDGSGGSPDFIDHVNSTW